MRVGQKRHTWNNKVGDAKEGKTKRMIEMKQSEVIIFAFCLGAIALSCLIGIIDALNVWKIGAS